MNKSVMWYSAFYAVIFAFVVGSTSTYKIGFGLAPAFFLVSILLLGILRNGEEIKALQASNAELLQNIFDRLHRDRLSDSISAIREDLGAFPEVTRERRVRSESREKTLEPLTSTEEAAHERLFGPRLSRR